MNINLVNITLAGYLLSFILYLLSLITRDRITGRIAFIILTVAMSLNGAAVIERWVTSGRPPLSNMYESLVFFAFSISLIYLGFEFRFKVQTIGTASSLVALFTLGAASFLTDSTIKPLVPALQSNWLVIHVISYFIGYAAVTIAFITALVALFRETQNIESTPQKGIKSVGPVPRTGLMDKKELSHLTYKIISFSFPFLTLGLITGAVWAKKAWGDYWSWDPKETWSLITWIIYLNYLHIPYSLPKLFKKYGREPKKHLSLYMNLCSILGFIATLFTYVGVNYILSGLHSYS